MPFPRSIPRRRRRTHGFTLVEVALALGIAGFVLAGLIGAIPLATNVGQQSIAQSRASSIASTVFANFRSQKFDAVPYLDDATAAPLNLDTLAKSSAAQVYFAYFDESITSAPALDARRLHFVAAAPAGVTAYQVTLHFDNNPAGTLAPYATAAVSNHSQANAVEATIFAVARPKDVYRFSSVIANRAE